MHNVELLVDVLNYESLNIALENGADAVCIGDGLKNFSYDDLRKSIELSHNLDKKIYLYFNKIPHEKDLLEIKKYLINIKDFDIDAIVVIDAGTLELVKQIIPSVRVHLSDQANITNYETAKFWYNQGINRLMISKELSLDEIGQIRIDIPMDMEIEVLAHGSILISHSGRSLLSNFIKDKTNKVKKDFDLTKDTYNLVEQKREGQYFPVYEDERGTFLYNTKDLCTLEYLPDIIKSGVYSLRIDTKFKNKDYIKEVVKAYRVSIDEFYAQKDKWKFNPIWIENLKKINHRELTSGFYLDEIKFD